MTLANENTAAAPDPSRVLIVIPARYASSRFPGKPLADLAGRPLIVRVVDNARRIAGVGEVVVATDDERIRAAVEAAGGVAVMTGEHPTGTDRIGEVLLGREADLVVNLQGDEPLLDPADVEDLIRAMAAHPEADIGTCAHPFPADIDAAEAAWRDPNVVKVVTDRQGRALYFSRLPIPGTFPGAAAAGYRAALRHVGIYAYRAPSLERFLQLARTPLEVAEGLEQLRALENGMTILVRRIARAPIGVDTPDDLEAVRRHWAEGGNRK